MNDNVRNDANSPTQSISGTTPKADPMGSESAGSLLRAARERSGLHIAALAAALKVPVRKLEALESNRWEELTDATFTRALASSVARHLKADPVAILAALPSHHPVPLVISDGLGKAAPDHKLRTAQGGKPLIWAIAVLLLGSVGMYLFPHVWPTETPVVAETASAMPDTLPTAPLQMENSPPAALSDAGAVTPNGAVVGNLPQPAEAAPVAAALVVTAAVAATEVKVAPTVTGGSLPLMVLKASRDTWVEATDNTGRLRIQRVVKAGEELAFTDAAALSVVIGNAAGAQVEVRGKPLDLAAVAKNNIARFEVK